MPSRSSTRNKRKHATNKKSASEIPYNATCVSLEISLLNACGVCKSKLEDKFGMGRKRQQKKSTCVTFLKEIDVNRGRH